MTRRCLSACALVALSPSLFGSSENGRPESRLSTAGPGTPATFAWGDVDGDGKLELAAVSADGALQLLASAGGDRFEDVSERVGLAGIADVALALWVDYDADGRLDLFVGARAGASRLFRNEGGLFVDMTAGVGLVTEGAVQSADWLDHDGDGRADLHVVSAERHELYRGLQGGFFERAELPALGAESVGAPGTVLVADAIPATPSECSSKESDSDAGATLPRRFEGARSSGDRIPLGPSPSVGGATPIVLLPGGCASSVQDQANPGTCLGASTTPALGKLYPLSTNLFVAISGDVGIGTTSPSAKLHVAGTARITDTLTLEPSGDQAIDVSTGNIYKNGALFIHTKGLANLAIGSDALANITTGYCNVASGPSALQLNTVGSFNVANGIFALQNNTGGAFNTASGSYSLRNNDIGLANTAIGNLALSTSTTGHFNTAVGTGALLYSTSGHLNVASGFYALRNNTSGQLNIAVGAYAGQNLTTGSSNIAIGNRSVAGESFTIRIGTGNTHTRAFIAGIRGVTTANANAIPVLIDSAGQLGTVSSSARFKQDIADMGDRTERLLELRPVVFRYEQEQTLPDGSEVPLEYGLIAEEVAEVFPDLVVHDEDGQPFIVKYHLLSAMLLNELKKLHEHGAEQTDELARQARELEELRARLEQLERVAPAAAR